MVWPSACRAPREEATKQSKPVLHRNAESRRKPQPAPSNSRRTEQSGTRESNIEVSRGQLRQKRPMDALCQLPFPTFALLES